METVIRVVIIYIFIVIGLRVVGKREFGQLPPLELVTLLIIPELVSQALVREDYSLTNAMIAVTMLIGCVYLSSLLQYSSKTVDRAVNSSPTVVVAHGELVGRHMNEERVTPEEIFAAMRQSGLDHLEQVKWALLESDGKISVVPEDKTKHQASNVKKQESVLA